MIVLIRHKIQQNCINRTADTFIVCKNETSNIFIYRIFTPTKHSLIFETNKPDNSISISRKLTEKNILIYRFQQT